MLEGVELPEGINAEVLEHLMNPHNYGKLEKANAVGVAVDEKTGEYVIMYLLLDDTNIADVKFATNGCQDTVVVGSMFTDMIMHKDTSYAQKAIEKLYKKLGTKMTQKQQICADMVLSAFMAAMKNRQNLLQGKEEEAHIVKMKESCEIGETNENNL